MAKVAQKKKSRPRTVYFYHVVGNSKEKDIIKARKKNTEVLKKIDDQLNKTYLNLKKHKSKEIKTVTMQGNKYYIFSMNKAYVDQSGTKFAWLIDLSRLDPDSKVEIGDMKKIIEKRNRQLKMKTNEGRVIDTQFLYDPNTHVCAFARTPGGLNKSLFKSFLGQFCSVRGFALAIIPDKDTISDLEKMKKPLYIEYTIAKIDNFSVLSNESQDELKDMKYASDVGATEMTMVLKSPKLNRKDIIDKAKLLFSNSDDLGIKKLKLEGIDNDGVFEPIDLIEHKLVYSGSVKYDNIITDEDMFNYLEVAYHENYEYCCKYFK